MTHNYSVGNDRLPAYMMKMTLETKVDDELFIRKHLNTLWLFLGEWKKKSMLQVMDVESQSREFSHQEICQYWEKKKKYPHLCMQMTQRLTVT